MVITSAHKKIAIMITLCVVFLLLFIFLVTLPTIDKVKKLSEEYLTNKERISRLDNRDNIISALKEDFKKNQSAAAKIDGAFLDPEEAIGFIYDLEKIAEQTNNEFEIQNIYTKQEAVSMEPALESQETIIPSIDFQVAVKGSYTNLLRFVANLEDTPYPPYRLIEIESFVVNNIKSGSQFDADQPYGSNDVRSVLNVKIYTL